MVAIDIEFEDEEEGKPLPASPIIAPSSDEMNLEFSASTELINLAATKFKDLHDESLIDISFEKESEAKPQSKVEISDEMKVVLNKVKAETAKVRSLEEARQKRPAPTPVKAPQAAPQSAEKKEESLSQMNQINQITLEAEIKVARAETRGEVSAFYLSEAKLLEYQIALLLKKLTPKNVEEQKIIGRILQRLAEHTKKKAT